MHHGHPVEELRVELLLVAGAQALFLEVVIAFNQEVLGIVRNIAPKDGAEHLVVVCGEDQLGLGGALAAPDLVDGKIAGDEIGHLVLAPAMEDIPQRRQPDQNGGKPLLAVHHLKGVDIRIIPVVGHHHERAEEVHVGICQVGQIVKQLLPLFVVPHVGTLIQRHPIRLALIRKELKDGYFIRIQEFHIHTPFGVSHTIYAIV